MLLLFCNTIVPPRNPTDPLAEGHKRNFVWRFFEGGEGVGVGGLYAESLLHFNKQFVDNKQCILGVKKIKTHNQRCQC